MDKQLIEKIYNRLPGSWSEFTFKNYENYLGVEMEVSVSEEDKDIIAANNTLRTISILSDTPIDEVKDLPPFEILKMATKLQFITTEPEILKKGKIQWKKIDEVTYDNLVTYLMFQEKLFENTALIIKTFSKSELTEDQIYQMGMDEIFTGFFLLRKQLKKSRRNTLMSLSLKLMKQIPMELFQHFKQKCSWRRKKSIPDTGGIS